jgi:two-component system OmpR family response regulator
MAEILVVDDDPHLREVVGYALTRQGHTVREARDGKEALARFEQRPADLVVLDVTMPEMDGLEACRRLRARSQVPILFLSSREEEVDRVLGLEMGGDDYLTKPFGTRELIARVKAVLRRASAAPVAGASLTLEAGALRLDLEAHRAFVAGEEVVFTVTEFSILRALMERPGRAFTREELVDRAYGEGHHLADRTLDSHIRRIRHKLVGLARPAIETVHGLGYRFAP